MTTSGSSAFTYNRDQIVKMALLNIGAIQGGETPGAQLIQDGADRLNLMMKGLEATGLHVWTETEATLFTQPGQAGYQMGPTATDNATLNTLGTTWGQSSLSLSATVGATSITLASASGVTTGMIFGIVLDGGNIQWTTVSGSPAGNVVALAAALTDSATNFNNVYFYGSRITRPLRIISARRVDLTSGLEIPMNPMLSRLDYRALPNKQAAGVPTQCFYDPQLGNGLFFIWPVPVDATSAINFTWWRPIQDFLTSANTGDLPTEWLNALIWNLSLELAPSYDVPPIKFQMVEKMAAKWLDAVTGFDREPESFYFGVAMDRQ